jgi:hypothetical protein
MKKKHIFIVIVVFFVLIVAGQIVSELPDIVQAVYGALFFGAMVWGIMWFVTNRRANAWFTAQIREFLRHLRG